MELKIRLTVMNFLQFAVWGSYLTCIGVYLSAIGMASHIGMFFAIQGIVSIFMPAIMGIVADRWIPAQLLTGICHLLAGSFMILAAFYGFDKGAGAEFSVLFSLYTASVAFYMPTLALTNSVSYMALTKAGMDTVRDFPPIRVFGTVGFICAMWFVDFADFKDNASQLLTSGVLSLVLFVYCFSLPKCPVNKGGGKKTVAEAFGLKAFQLFRKKEMAVFFIFSALLGVCLQITNGFATPFIESFGADPQYADTYGVRHANILYSVSQISETCCILLIPVFMKRFGIKRVMLIAMFAWTLRFAFLGMGNPGGGVWLFIASMIIYGMAFDFFNISGSLFVDQTTDADVRSSAQGLFMLMTNGIGATVGALVAQAVVNWQTDNGVVDWPVCWYVFAAYALLVCIVFAFVFNPKTK